VQVRNPPTARSPSEPESLGRYANDAISYVLGSIRAIGYFQTVDGQCEVTVMIAGVFDPDRAAPGPATRLHFAMRPKQVAALTSEEGPEMVLSCGGEAATVEVTRDAAKP
jgi:hypothetical protein